MVTIRLGGLRFSGFKGLGLGFMLKQQLSAFSYEPPMLLFSARVLL